MIRMCLTWLVYVCFFQLEKLHALGVRSVLFLSRPGRKPNACMTEILVPRCHLTEMSNACLQKMKDLFNIVIQGKNVCCLVLDALCLCHRCVSSLIIAAPVTAL